MRLLTTLLIVTATVQAAPAAGQAAGVSQEQGRIVIGGQGLEVRNGPIGLGEGAIVTGPLTARNGSISIGPRSEIRSVTSRNGRISIGAQTIVSGGVLTRNGPITLERGASVSRHIESRSGRIELAPEVRVEGSVDSRNGPVMVGAGALIGGAVRTRNGAITLEPGAWVEGNVATRNGTIQVEDARVSRDIDMQGGDLRLLGRTRVDGDVIVLMPEDDWLARVPFLRPHDRRPVVRIDPGVQVGGRLIIDERVRLEIASGAAVPEPEIFSGRREWERRRR